MKISMKYFSIIGIILFIIILSRVDIGKLFSIILSSNYLLLVLAFLIVVIEVLLRSTKWKRLINIFNKDYSLKDALRTYLIGFAFGAVTPSKAGDLVKIVDLEDKTKIETKRCFSISVFDRIVDFLMLIFTALIGSLVGVFLFFELDYILLPILAVLMILFFLIIFGLTRYSKVILRPFYYLIPGIFKDKAKGIYNSFREIINVARNDKSFFAYLLVTFIAWLVTYLTPYFIALSIGLDVSLVYFLVLIPIVAVVEALPVTLLGIGSRDVALLVLFSPLGFVREEIIGISLIVLFISQIPRAVVGFLISWRKGKK